MGAVDWTLAGIHASRVRTPNRPPKEIPIIAPSRIEVDDVRWIAVRTAPKCELRVAQDLAALGYRPYCPLGAKFVFWKNGRQRAQRKFVRQFPVFAGYIFVGLSAGRVLARDTVEKIVSILGDSSGPLRIPPSAIGTINSLETAYHWDETRSWREKSPFKPGSPIRVTDGAYASYNATVDVLVSETRIKVLASMFGRMVPIELDMGSVEAV